MASDPLYLEWAIKKEGPVFYIPATLLRAALERKQRDLVQPAVKDLRAKLVTQLDGLNTEDFANLLIALGGQDAGHAAAYIGNVANECAQTLQLSADLDMINRNLVEGATYVLDTDQLKEFGL